MSSDVTSNEASAASVPSSGWQDIVTAPHDGTEVLVWGRAVDIAIASAKHIPGHYDNWPAGWGYPSRATHWMALPLPPSEGTEPAQSIDQPASAPKSHLSEQVRVLREALTDLLAIRGDSRTLLERAKDHGGSIAEASRARVEQIRGATDRAYEALEATK